MAFSSLLPRPQDLFGYKIELLPVQYIMAILDYLSADILKVSLVCVCVCVCVCVRVCVSIQYL